MQSLFLFLWVYIISFLVVMGSDSWFLIWFGLEMNMISFISIIYNRGLMNVEACLKYFFIQSIGSGMFVGSFYFDFYYLSMVMIMVLSYKMGGGVFFFWFPSLCEGLGWLSCFFLMTLQKIMPLMLLSMFLSEMVWMMVFFGIFFGVVGAFSEIKLKKLLAYSSVYHLGWIMMSMFIGGYSWIIYLILYAFMLLGIVNVFNFWGVSDVSDLVKLSNSFMLIIGVLNMGGMPPMMGFFMKWYMFVLMKEFSIMFFILMILFSVVMFYVYFRLVFSVLLGNKKVLVLEDYVSEMSGFSMEEFYVFGSCMGPMIYLYFL